MFGYVKPYNAELKVKQDKLYQAIYCTLCKRQKKLTGAISSFALSYDFVFLALMRNALTDERMTVTNSRCGYNPLKKRPCINATDSVDYTAYAATLLTYYKLKDNLSDGKWYDKIKYGMACMLFAPAKNKAVKKCALPEKEVIELLSRLSEFEKSENPTLDQCADIFGQLLGIIASYNIEDRLTEDVMHNCFYQIGKWIYIIDAVDDYPEDITQGNFNPFGSLQALDFEMIDCTLQSILQNVDRYILKIRFSDEDIGDIIKNIIYLGTDHVSKHVFDNCRDKMMKLKGNAK